jgi:hypothetical protein
MPICIKSVFSTLAFLIFGIATIFAQNNEASYERTRPSFEIQKTPTAVKIDGLLHDSAWLTAAKTSAFHLCRPYDSSYASLQTQAMITYDDKYIYVAAICYQPRAYNTVASLKRDFEGGASDVFTFSIDTFRDRLNGFQFALSPMGVQREGLLVGGEMTSNFWDNVWYSAVKNYDDRWELEMAIPFKSIRYKVGDHNVWGLNFGRNSLKANEISTWSPVPRNFLPGNPAFFGDLHWLTPPPSPKANVSLIPYTSARLTADYPHHPESLAKEPKNTDNNLAAGLDAKIGLGPSLNLDLTFNPDFSNVEVDRQVTNLSRFELFFPERRQFFLENNDLFGTFGFPDSRPFFTRRMGIAYNPSTGQNSQVGILAGARLSGKINNNLRIGLMNLQTKAQNFGADNKLPASNYTVAILQHKLWKRSTISGIYVNKSSDLSAFTQSQKAGFQAYNRVLGLELNLNSANNRFESETYIHRSYSPLGGTDASSAAAYVGYHHPNADINLGLMRIGKDYRADVGFVPRTGIINVYRPLEFVYYTKNPKLSKTINTFTIGMYENADTYDLSGKALEHDTNIFVQAGSPTGALFFTGWGWQYTYLYAPFDPTNASLDPNPDNRQNIAELPIGGYRSGGYFAGYESSQRNNLSVNVYYNNGQFFNSGSSVSTEGVIAYRVQPIGVFALNFSSNIIKMPKPYQSANYWLLGPRAELSFSKSLFFSNFLQFNTQTNNFNLNSRLQWRFKPVSDIFLVYTDNRFTRPISKYGITSFEPKNRALVFKMTYWFNV